MNKNQITALINLPKGIQGLITLFEQEAWVDNEFDYGFAFHFFLEFCEAFITQKEAKAAVKLLKEAQELAADDAETQYTPESVEEFSKAYDGLWHRVEDLKAKIDNV